MKKNLLLFFFIWYLIAGLGAGIGFLLYEYSYDIREMVDWQPVIIILIGFIIGTIVSLIVLTLIKALRESSQKSNSIKTIPEKQNSIADELKKYKNLLDEGAITQEEFDKKKKQLLNL